MRESVRKTCDAYRIEECDRNIIRVCVTDTLTDDVGRGIRTDIIGCLDEGKMNFIVDFREMSMIVSAGLGILVSLNMMMASREAKYVVVNACPNIRNVFRVTKLDNIVNIVESEEEALKALLD